MSRVVLCKTLLLSLVLACGTAQAQVVKGSMSGAVVDPTGAVVPNAAIRAVHIETGAEFKTTADSDGLFRLSLLPIGTYRVEVTQEGFNKLILSQVSVSSGADRGLGNLKLQLGQITSTVEVSSAPPLMTTSEAQVSTGVTSSQLTAYPGILENQGMDNLALFVPGISNTRDLSFSNSNQTGGFNFAANGLRGRNNDQQIDGQNNNDNSVGGPSLFVTNAEFVEEFKITTSNFGAEFGRNSGSVVNIVTKSGTNDWRGTIFGTVNNSALNTLNTTQKHFQGLSKLPRVQDTFVGGTAGGPFAKDRVFFFSGFDTQIINSIGNFSAAQTPTPTGLAALAGCFTGSVGLDVLSTYGPFGVTGGNPQVSGTPSSVTVTGPASGVVCNNVELAGVQRTLDTTSRQWDWLLRGDVNFDKDRFYVRYLYQRVSPLNTNAFGTAAAGYPANVPSRTHGVGVSWTRTVSDRMVNEFRFNWSRLEVQFGTNQIGNTIPSKDDIDQALARINFAPTSLLDFGPTATAPQGRTVKTLQLQDNWNWFRGRHQLKAGVNYTFQKSPNAFLPNLNGTFTFASLGALMDNVPSSIQIANGDPTLGFEEHQVFLYFGDDWKITNDLVFNLGLTYSFYGQPANLFHDETVRRESDASTAFWDPALPLEVRTFPKIDAPKDSLGPSAGFAYTPRWGGWLTGEGKTVFRGGYRLSYDPPFYNIYLNISTAAPQVFLQTITGANAASNPIPADPFGPTVRAQLASFLTLGVFDPRRFSQTTISNNFGPQRVHSWSLGIQRELRPNAVLEARYVGNRGTNLFQSINSNPLVSPIVTDFPNALPSGVTPCPAASAVVPSAVGRVDCNRGVVRERANTSFSNYHGLQLNFRGTNIWKQLTVNTSYTWSKTTDNASEIFGTFGAGGTLAFAQNPLDFNNGEKGLSGLHIPQNWTIAFQEEVPVFRAQQGLLGKLLGGWAISGSYIIASGQPYTPSQFALSAFSGAPYNDVPFNNSFAGTFDVVRPFIGNLSAPVGQVGIFAADACNNFGVGCAQPAGTLLSLNEINVNSAETIVSQNDVRFIVNGQEANNIFGTPFGNAGRNILRNYHTNIANATIFKNTKFGEQVSVRWHVTMTNVFNHPNFTSVDPFIDDAGLTDDQTGFANVRLFPGASSTTTPQRRIFFGIRIGF